MLVSVRVQCMIPSLTLLYQWHGNLNRVPKSGFDGLGDETGGGGDDDDAGGGAGGKSSLGE